MCGHANLNDLSRKGASNGTTVANGEKNAKKDRKSRFSILFVFEKMAFEIAPGLPDRYQRDSVFAH